MRQTVLAIRDQLDRAGVLLSGLCVIHCLAGLLLVAGLGLGGEALLAPVIHRVGLALASAIAAATLTIGVMRHGDHRVLQVGAAGLGMMVAGLFVDHGMPEAVLTIIGVILLGYAHIRNLHQLG